MANLFGDPYNLQGGSVNLQGGTMAPAPSPTPTPTVQSTQRKKASYSTIAPQATSPRDQYVQNQFANQVGSSLSPFIGARASGSNPGVAEFYRTDNGQGFSNPNDLFSYASGLGYGDINSFDQLKSNDLQRQLPQSTQAGMQNSPTPTAPDNSNPGGSTPIIGNNDQDAYIKTLAQNYFNSFAPSQEQLDTQNQYNNLLTSRDMGIVNLRNQPVPMDIITGGSQNILENAGVQADALGRKLDYLEQQRQFRNQAAQANLNFGEYLKNFYKPQEVSPGSQLVDPQTGRVIVGSNVPVGAQKMEMDTVLNLAQSYPDAGILPSDTLAVAQAKASQSNSFQIKNTTIGAIANPLTGAVSFYNKKGPYDTSGSGFTKAPNSPQVYYNGTPIDLPTYKRLTGQTNVPDNKVDFSAVQTQLSSTPSPLGGVNGTLPTNPADVYNLDVAKGMAGANANITNQVSQQVSAYNTLMQNGQLLLQSMAGNGINLSQFPDRNALDNFIKSHNGDAGIMAAYDNTLNTLRNEYSTLLAAKNGTTTDKVRGEVDRVLPANLAPSQLAQVLERIRQEGLNNISSQLGVLGDLRSNVTNIPFNSGQAAPAPAFNLNGGSSGGSASAANLDLRF